MAASSNYLKKALDYVNENKQKQELKAKQQRDEVYADNPEIKAIDCQISELFNKTMRLMLNSQEVDFDEAKQMSLRLQQERKNLLSQKQIDEQLFRPCYKCTLCSDSGYYEGKLCDCVKKLASKLMYDDLNADVPLDKCTFKTFKTDYYPDIIIDGENSHELMTNILSFCKKYAKSFSDNSKNLFFFGKTGLGKTHLSLAIANEVIKKGCSVVYGPLSHLLGAVEKEHFGKSDSAKTLEGLFECDLLILDDLGCEFNTQFTASTIYDIINTRILRKKPTIINTNLEIDELENKYSQRVVSRVYGCYKLFRFVGEDIRYLT